LLDPKRRAHAKGRDHDTRNPAAHRGKPQMPARLPTQPVLSAGSVARPARVLLRAQRLSMKTLVRTLPSRGGSRRRQSRPPRSHSQIHFTRSINTPGHSPPTRPSAPDAKYPGNPVFSECQWVKGRITDCRSIPPADRLSDQWR